MSQPSDPRRERLARIQEAAGKSAYPVEAFLFVLRTMSRSAPGHIDADETCWRLHDRALVTFGPQARRQLERWGIRSCHDFGNIVYGLVDVGLIFKTEGDALEDFDDVFQFDRAFQTLARPPWRWQWRLSTLFIGTTIAAIALAGAARIGFYGAVGTVFAAWLMLVGAVCALLNGAERSPGWLLGVCVGAAFGALGVGLFLAIILHAT